MQVTPRHASKDADNKYIAVTIHEAISWFERCYQSAGCSVNMRKLLIMNRIHRDEGTVMATRTQKVSR